MIFFKNLLLIAKYFELQPPKTKQYLHELNAALTSEFIVKFRIIYL